MVQTFLDTIQDKPPHYQLYEINRKIYDWRDAEQSNCCNGDVSLDKYDRKKYCHTCNRACGTHKLTRGLLLQVNELTTEKFKIIKTELNKAKTNTSNYSIEVLNPIAEGNYEFIFTQKDGSPGIKVKFPKRMWLKLETAYLRGELILDEKTSN